MTFRLATELEDLCERIEDAGFGSLSAQATVDAIRFLIDGHKAEDVDIGALDDDYLQERAFVMSLKDEIIKLIEDEFEGTLSDEEVSVLRKLTKADLYLIQMLVRRVFVGAYAAGKDSVGN